MHDVKLHLSRIDFHYKDLCVYSLRNLSALLIRHWRDRNANNWDMHYSSTGTSKKKWNQIDVVENTPLSWNWFESQFDNVRETACSNDPDRFTPASVGVVPISRRIATFIYCDIKSESFADYRNFYNKGKKGWECILQHALCRNLYGLDSYQFPSRFSISIEGSNTKSNTKIYR